MQGCDNQKDMQKASAPHLCRIDTSLSEPEDGMPSDVESFDDEDLYSAGYDDEAVSCETVSDCPESDGEPQLTLGGLVCASYYV
jgi:hypothetical protein